MKKLVVFINPDQNGEESYSSKWIELINRELYEVILDDITNIQGYQRALNSDIILSRILHNPNNKLKILPILNTLEILGKRTFPKYAERWHYDDKIAQYYIAKTLNFPLARTEILYSLSDVFDNHKRWNYPLIVKLKAGAGSKNVLRISNQNSLLKFAKAIFQAGIFPMELNPPNSNLIFKTKNILLSCFRIIRGNYPKLDRNWWIPEKNYLYIQEFLPGNDFDTRITVIGDKAFGYRRLNRPNDFRASGSGLLDYDQTKIGKDLIRLAFEMNAKGKFDCMAYDFVRDSQGNPVLLEFSYTFKDDLVYNCPGYWTVELEFVQGNYSPQQAILDVLLRD